MDTSTPCEFQFRSSQSQSLERVYYSWRQYQEDYARSVADDALMRTLTGVLDRFTHESRYRRALRQWVDSYTPYGPHTRTEPATLVQGLRQAAHHPSVRLSTAQIRQQIAQVPHTQLEEITSNLITLSMTHLHLTPTHNPWENHDVEVPEGGIPLPEMLIHLHSNLEVRITLGPEQEGITGHAGRPVPHPHVLDHEGTSCFGDFGGPITEALHSGDLTTALLVIREFLSHANTDDSAGRLWFRFILGADAPIPPNSVCAECDEYFSECTCDDDDDY